MSNVIILPVVTTLDIPPERVLQQAIEAELTEVLVIGFNKDGSEYFASSVAAGGDALWHLERAKIKLLAAPDK